MAGLASLMVGFGVVWAPFGWQSLIAEIRWKQFLDGRCRWGKGFRMVGDRFGQSSGLSEVGFGKLWGGSSLEARFRMLETSVGAALRRWLLGWVSGRCRDGRGALEASFGLEALSR